MDDTGGIGLLSDILHSELDLAIHHFQHYWIISDDVVSHFILQIQEVVMFKMVDVCGGKMSLDDLKLEITHYLFEKSPRRMIIDIQLKKNVGYISTIWMPKRDFKKTRKRR